MAVHEYHNFLFLPLSLSSLLNVAPTAQLLTAVQHVMSCDYISSKLLVNLSNNNNNKKCLKSSNNRHADSHRSVVVT